MNQPTNLPPAEIHDNTLRWLVPSRSNPEDRQMVDLEAYNGEGRCACKDFATRFEKFLARGMTAKQVWDEGWLANEPGGQKLRPYHQGPEDCLSCWHLCQARAGLARTYIRAVVAARKAQR